MINSAWSSVDTRAIDPDTVRVALITAANSGGRDRTNLKYARSDARKFSSVFEQLGGLHEGNRILLLETDKDRLDRAFTRIKQLVEKYRTTNNSVEFIFYYSGHSNENGLLLGNQIYPYDELRANLRAINANIRIAILDSCNSGVITRLKGGQFRKRIMLNNRNIKGHAFLTSSSSDENAQESDALGASFFTHYLVSGLRGAADTTADGKITLSEAYTFAFHETIKQTQNSRGGTQHPSYEIDLAGKQELVLTDLRRGNTTVLIPADYAGTFYFRDSQDLLVAEVSKRIGIQNAVALPQGRFSLVWVNGDKWRRANITTMQHKKVLLVDRMFEPFNPVATYPRGARPRFWKPETRGQGFMVGLYKQRLKTLYRIEYMDQNPDPQNQDPNRPPIIENRTHSGDHAGPIISYSKQFAYFNSDISYYQLRGFSRISGMEAGVNFDILRRFSGRVLLEFKTGLAAFRETITQPKHVYGGRKTSWSDVQLPVGMSFSHRYFSLDVTAHLRRTGTDQNKPLGVPVAIRFRYQF